MIGLTDDSHYKAISNAIRALHDGTETYTPAEMGEYLATQGTELKSENVKKDVVIFGVTGAYEGDTEGAYNEGYDDGYKDGAASGGGEQSIRPNLAALSKMGVYLKDPSVSSYTQDGYRWHIKKADMTSGLWVDLSDLIVGELYTFSYKFKKTDGALRYIGGHDTGFKECTWSIDGVEQGWSYNTGAATVPNNEDVHEVVYTGVYHGTDVDNEIYIQPNRMDETYVAFDVWDIKMERVNRVTAWIPAAEDEQKE